MRINILILFFIYIKSKIKLEWTEETYAEKNTDCINLGGEYSINAFRINNLKASPIQIPTPTPDPIPNEDNTLISEWISDLDTELITDLVIKNLYLNILVETKIGGIYVSCICDIEDGKGHIKCDFPQGTEQFESIKIYEIQENVNAEGSFNKYL